MKIIKYFFEFLIIISLFICFKLIGLKSASNTGSILGNIIGPFVRSKEITKKNIVTAFGCLSENEETKIINGMWSNIGRTFAEYAYLKDFRFNNLKFRHINIVGINHLEQIKKKINL